MEVGKLIASLSGELAQAHTDIHHTRSRMFMSFTTLLTTVDLLHGVVLRKEPLRSEDMFADIISLRKHTPTQVDQSLQERQ